jgi:hypothetical protein
VPLQRSLPEFARVRQLVPAPKDSVDNPRAFRVGLPREAFGQRQQLRGIHVERLSQPGEGHDAGLALGALDAAYVVAMDARAEAKLLLRDVLLVTGRSNGTSEADEQRLVFGHRRDGASRAGCMLQPNRVITPRSPMPTQRFRAGVRRPKGPDDDTTEGCHGTGGSVMTGARRIEITGVGLWPPCTLSVQIQQTEWGEAE